MIYEGKWKDDRQEGIGTEKWNNGTSYTGEFKLGQKTGKGKFKYIDDANYTGNFLNNQMHGKGIYIWSDGREYNGDWKYNKIEGEGVFKWPDERRYIGHYKNDKKDGYGIFEWPNGKKYKGFWKNGKQQGEGESYDPIERKWIKGYWNEGKKDVGILINLTKEEIQNEEKKKILEKLKEIFSNFKEIAEIIISSPFLSKENNLIKILIDLFLYNENLKELSKDLLIFFIQNITLQKDYFDYIYEKIGRQHRKNNLTEENILNYLNILTLLYGYI